MILSILFAIAAFAYEGNDYPTDHPVQTLDQKSIDLLKRDAEQKGAKVKIITGHSNAEVAEGWHISEGADFMPLKWMMNMRSATQGGTPLIQDMDQKFGVIKESDEFAKTHDHPLKYVGITTAWSDERLGQRDVHLKPGQSLKDLMNVNTSSTGQQSIAMTGTNCTFCHTQEMKMNGNSHVRDGVPAVMAARPFFQDMAGSILKTMLKEEVMEQYLKDIGYSNAEAKAKAKDFTSRFRSKMGITNETAASAIEWAASVVRQEKFIQDKGMMSAKEALYKNRSTVVPEFLGELLKLSYKGYEPTPELKARMNWLAWVMGPDPHAPQQPTNDSGNTAEAFGLIFNSLRHRLVPDHPEYDKPLTAPVGFPPMWCIEDQATFHYNDNMNSRVARDFGQAMGLGAVCSDDQKAKGELNCTVDLLNIRKLNRHINNTRVPSWQRDFGKTNPVNIDAAIQGCNLYQQNCAKCHDSKERVGPQKALIPRKLIPLSVVGTDYTYIVNQAKEVGPYPFKSFLFEFTDKQKKKFYKDYGIDLATQCEWEQLDKIGVEYFRDPLKDKDVDLKGTEIDYLQVKGPGLGYTARSLAGLWTKPGFLHNNSVPSLQDLLTPAAKRPEVFFVGSNEYDPEKMGFKNDLESNVKFKQADLEEIKVLVTAKNPDERLTEEQAKIHVACKNYPGKCYETSRRGKNNIGHEGAMFGTTWEPGQKKQLMEFMKILRPESECSWDEKPLYTVEKDGSCKKVATAQ